ncbi:argininosuccinate lyase [Algiphilus sp.]|uniref:argininosuccinate lyase n=1 Tax=Algiphilus sp. TaxID=1872431 RepID=UPI0025BE41D5|nr:argininosuccinate lyase [Algiphilus sp.]MCK5770580.1 argininosuccinate lyase [Algiphilus sp.]
MSNAKLWGGRFSESTSEAVEAFSESVSFDARLWRQDIAGSKAHARMLGRVGVLSGADVTAICEGLDTIASDIAAGDFVWDTALEDVHMNIESALTERIGEAGKRLHTGRSRNDQIATDVRLYVRDAIDALVTDIDRLSTALVDLAEAEADTIMPGFTHLQVAQPVSFGHHMLAWREQILRDRARLMDARKRANICPLGSAALAGTVYPIDRESVAADLGFDGITANSLDAVSDRDFAIEFVHAAGLLMVHLSRWSEELILWSTPMFGFVQLPDRFCTGSSIMPQKKNPDVPELVRGKTARVTGDLMSLLMLMKGQPLAYNRDNQEDKEPLFDAHDTVAACVGLYADLIPALAVNRETCRRAAVEGYSTATDLADYLVRKGMAFRDAHHVVGGVVAQALDEGRELAAMPLDALQAFSAEIEDDVFDVLRVEGSVAARDHAGGTAPAQVRAAVARARAAN